MNRTIATTRVPSGRASCELGTRVTKSLLGYGVIAGPFYVITALTQAIFRPGFNLTRDDVSLLSNGPLGWIQIVNFVATGAMVIVCAAGIRRATMGGCALTWAPRLLALYGLGLVAAGIFVADPMNGFPPGTPPGQAASISVHGMLHIAAAGIGFLCLIAACFVLARRFASLGQRPWAVFSRGTGVLFFAAFMGVASGSSSPVVVLGFWLALLVAWAWLAVVAIHLYRNVGAGSDPAAA